MTHKNITAVKNLSALVDFGKQINSNLDLNFTIDNLLFTLFGKLLINKGAVLLRNEKGELYPVRAKGVEISDEKIDLKIFADYSEHDEFLTSIGLKHIFPSKE